MIKAVIFDLDGVLIKLKQAHYECLNRALNDFGHEITEEEHYRIYDGLPTREKLKILTEEKGLNPHYYDRIYELKQKYTIEYILNMKKDKDKIKMMEELSKKYKIALASNSIRNTIFSAATVQGYIGLIDLVLSNQDVNNPKPNPEIYLKTISQLGLDPKECLILEDSPYGVESAQRSGANVMKVKDPEEVTLENIIEYIKELEQLSSVKKWNGDDWQILIPMAGEGSRFAKAGYTFPKPLIEVDGKPMIQVVVENLNINAEFIYIVRKEHYEKYNLKYLLNILTPNCKIIQVDHLTEGAACTTLLAKKYINNDKRLLIANSDQFIEWDSNRFYYTAEDTDIDGLLPTFENTHPKWSYAKVENGYVTEVAEKKPISKNATVGIYYWKKGSDYVKAAEQMIKKNIRTNNEFYIAPTYNEAIEEGKKIKIYPIDKMWGLGTPEDLNKYLNDFPK